MKTILLATDGSASARRATEEAIELALETGWSLQIVSVWSPPKAMVGYGVIVPLDAGGDAERQQAENVVDAAAEKARAAGLQPKTAVRRGNPASEICARAGVIGADLIVIGSHGRGPVKRAALGSVSTRVLHHAPCPVLIVRGDIGAGPGSRRSERAAAVR